MTFKVIELSGIIVEHFLQVRFVRIMFAADIAEMLYTEMQKEGLCGRTLTLKLKTASFEVLLNTLLLFLCTKTLNVLA